MARLDQDSAEEGDRPSGTELNRIARKRLGTNKLSSPPDIPQSTHHSVS